MTTNTYDENGWIDEDEIEDQGDPDHEIVITLKTGEVTYHGCPSNWWEDDSWQTTPTRDASSRQESPTQPPGGRTCGS